MVVLDAHQGRFFNYIDGVIQIRDNPNPVTYLLKCVVL